MIYYNGTLLTMDEAQPQAQAIAVEDGHIVAVGSNAEVLNLQQADTATIDLQGRTLMPGFVDAHAHLLGTPADPGQEILSSYELAQAETDLDDMEHNQAIALRFGVTATGEMAVGPELAEKIVALDQAGKLYTRTNMYLTYNDGCGNLQGDWYKAYPAGRVYSDKLRVGGIKIWADGGSCKVPAVSFEFPDGLGHGDLYYTQEELNAMVADLQTQGYQVCIHTLGDRSLEQIQNTFAVVLDGQPNTYRHRIEHNAVIRPDLMDRYTAIDAVLIIFGAFPTCFKTGGYEAKFNVPPEYQAWEWPYRDLIDANPGLPFAWHSDWPVTTLDTSQHLYGYTTRKQLNEYGDVCEPPADLASGIVTIGEALRAMAIGAAYALSRDEEIGSLKPGKYADLIILSGNPLTTAPDDLVEIRVLMTMVGGQAMHCTEGQEALCPQGVALGADPAPTQGPETQESEQLPGSNVALGKAVTASGSTPENPPERAVDGDLDTAWNSGGDAPQWLEIDLGAPVNVGQVRLVVAQDPAGETVHIIWGKEPGEAYRQLAKLRGMTSDGQSIGYTPEQPRPDVQFIKVETVTSPSWIAWREIEIVAAGE